MELHDHVTGLFWDRALHFIFSCTFPINSLTCNISSLQLIPLYRKGPSVTPYNKTISLYSLYNFSPFFCYLIFDSSFCFERYYSTGTADITLLLLLTRALLVGAPIPPTGKILTSNADWISDCFPLPELKSEICALLHKHVAVRGIATSRLRTEKESPPRKRIKNKRLQSSAETHPEIQLCETVRNANRTGILANRQWTYFVPGYYPLCCLYIKTPSCLFIKHNVSETVFCIRPQVKPTQLGTTR